MNSGDSASLIWGVMMVILLISSLAARRLPFGQVAKMSLAWIAIFAGLFALFSFRNEFNFIWERVKSDIAGTANQKLVGKELRLVRDDNGHFNVRTKVNGQPVDFLVDTGATTTAMSIESARDAGVQVDISDIPMIVSTANGNAKSWRAKISNFDVAGIQIKDHNVLVGEGLRDINLLGMNFLNSLSSWKVEGNEMILKP